MSRYIFEETKASNSTDRVCINQLKRDLAVADTILAILRDGKSFAMNLVIHPFGGDALCQAFNDLTGDELKTVKSALHKVAARRRDDRIADLFKLGVRIIYEGEIIQELVV